MIRTLNVVLALALLGGSAVAWFGLPDTIPIHFDLAGRPDRWVDTSSWSWFTLPLLGVVTAGGMTALGRWIGRRPEWVNLPAKERYLALSDEEREPVDAVLRELMDWVTCFVLVLFGIIQVMIFREATGADTTGFTALILVVSVLSGPAMTAVALVRLQRAMDRAWSRHRARGGG